MTQENHAETETGINGESQGSAPVSSESGQEPGGIPDGSGTDLPQEQQPNDDGGERFDAG